jgi:hypothetical protein
VPVCELPPEPVWELPPEPPCPLFPPELPVVEPPDMFEQPPSSAPTIAIWAIREMRGIDRIGEMNSRIPRS